MPDVSYMPGGRTAIVADPCWVLVDATPDSPAVTRIWQWAGQTPRLDALLAGLVRDGLAAAPDFALLVAGETGRHLICRGQPGATVTAGGASTHVTGAGLVTWLECQVPADAETVVLGEPPPGSALRLPAAAGVLLAGCVIVDFTAARETVSQPVVSQPVVSQETVPNAVSDVHPGAMAYPDTVTLTHPGSIQPRGQADRAAAGPAEDTDYDFLWGATQMRSVEDAAVRPDEDVAGPLFGIPAAVQPPSPPPAPPPRVAPPAPPSPVAPPAPPPLAAPGGLIDAVPWAVGRGEGGQETARSPGITGAAPPLFAPPPGAAAVADDDGATVTRGDLPKLAARVAPPDRIGPTVHALLCPDSHLNPPSSAACRRCGQPLPQQDPVTVPRPVLGVLRLSTGDVITLDRGVVMGRSPRADFTGAEGEERPHVVKLPSADGDISRTHLHVSLDGWHVLVTDLNSTNGTLVTLPGRDPEQIRPGTPMPIQPGTVVTLADGIDFRYEVTE